MQQDHINQVNQEVLLYRLENQDKRLDSIDKKQDDILARLEDKYVSKDEFGPVKAVVFGMVGLILTSFAVAVILVATHWGN